MVTVEDDIKPEPDTATEVPTGPLLGDRKMLEYVVASVVTVIVGGCSTRTHKPDSLPLLVEHMGEEPLKVATAPYQIESSAELNATEPCEVTGSSSIVWGEVLT